MLSEAVWEILEWKDESNDLFFFGRGKIFFIKDIDVEKERVEVV